MTECQSLGETTSNTATSATHYDAKAAPTNCRAGFADTPSTTTSTGGTQCPTPTTTYRPWATVDTCAAKECPRTEAATADAATSATSQTSHLPEPLEPGDGEPDRGSRSVQRTLPVPPPTPAQGGRGPPPPGSVGPPLHRPGSLPAPLTWSNIPGRCVRNMCAQVRGCFAVTHPVCWGHVPIL